MEVHNALGCGFQEVIYQRALALEMDLQNIAYKREFEMPIYYKGVHLGTRRVDFFVEETVSVELKAVAQLSDTNLSQAINYLEAYHVEIGLLINFGERSLKVRRVINSKIV